MEIQDHRINSVLHEHSPYSLFRLRTLLAGAIFAMAVLGLYANTLDSPFVFDDVPFIQKNLNVAINSLAWDNLKNAALDSPRPLTNLSFAINYYFSGNNTASYHMVNMGLHVLAGLGMYWLLLGLSAIPAMGGTKGRVGWVPFLASLLWLVHPVQTSAVNYIVQRSIIMASMFCLWSMAAYVQARLADQARQKTYWALSLGLWLLAMACKETALALPFAVLVLEWFLFQDLRREWARCFGLILGGFFVLSIMGAYLFLGTHPLDSVLFDYKNFDFSLKQRLLTEPRVLVHYLSLLVFPYPGRLVLDYDFTPSRALFSPMATSAALAVVLGLLAAAIALARKFRLASYAVLWFFITLFLESSFIPLDLAFEHRLYLPSVFPVFAVTAFLLARQKYQKPAIVSLLCVAVIFGVWTYRRNQVWQTDISLWQDTVSKAPGNARAHNNLGLALANARQDDEALVHFKKAIELKPGFAYANYNVGISLAHQEEHEKAIPYFKKALEAEPENVVFLNDLALAYMGAGNLEAALEHLYQALRLEPEYAPTHNNLGVALGGQAMITEALEHFRKAVELVPDYADAHRNLGILLANLDNHPKAIEHFSRILEAHPRDPQAHFFMGRSYAAMGNYKKAVQQFKETLQTVPDYIPALYNIGLVYMGLRDYPEAAKYFERILKLKPGNMDASRQLKKCLDITRAKKEGRQAGD